MTESKIKEWMKDYNQVMNDLAKLEEIEKLKENIKNMQVDLDEQCKLNLMGGDRELKLLNENADLRSKIRHIEHAYKAIERWVFIDAFPERHPLRQLKRAMEYKNGKR